TFLLRDRDEVLVHVRHHHAGLVAHERDREQRLESARAARDYRDRACRRDSGDVAVAEELHRTDALPLRVARTGLVRAPDALRPLREWTAVLREKMRLALSFDCNEFHDAAA